MRDLYLYRIRRHLPLIIAWILLFGFMCIIALRAHGQTLIKDGSFGLEWDANSEPDIVSYSVYESATPGGPYTKIGTVQPSATQAGRDLLLRGHSIR